MVASGETVEKSRCTKNNCPRMESETAIARHNKQVARGLAQYRYYIDDDLPTEAE